MVNHKDQRLYRINGRSIYVNNRNLYKRLNSIGHSIEFDIKMIKDIGSDTACGVGFDSLSKLILLDYFDCRINKTNIINIYIEDFASTLMHFWLDDEKLWKEFPFIICGITIKECLRDTKRDLALGA